MSLKKYLSVLFFLCLVFVGKAQYSYKRLTLSPALIYQNNFSGGFTIMDAYYDRYSGLYVVMGPFIGTEVVFDNPSPVIAPKIGYQISTMLVCARVSEINYFHARGTDVRLLPEIGIDLVGKINLCYGYNIHVAGNQYSNISNNRITLIYNILTRKPS